MYKQAVILLAAQALVVVAAGAVCPDREVCEETHTCCQGPNGEYSCCPHHQGECCNDHLHCCPENMVCQTEEGKSGCANATHSLPWADRIPPQQNSLLKSLRVISASPEKKDAVVCPDKSFCPSEFSCVRLPLSYGCCPIAEGVVCADGKHCCPADMQCSSDGKSCIQPQEPVSAVICSDGISECPQGASCCQSSDGVWGCCPFPKAVCCDDKEHCCPEHSICDVASSKCISESNQHMPMWAKFPARLRADWENQKPQLPSKGNDVPCDDTSACPDDNTCCKTAEGKWACCPLPKAVCCPDHEHCCPEGTTCGPDTCLSPQGPVPMLTKMAALVLPPKPNDVPCDDTSACPDDNTCCKNAEGEWACCPLPKAVCCPDHEYCCPEGTTCGPDTCLSPQGPVPMLTKMAALVKLPAVVLPPKPNDVPCDDTSACPDDNTCCKTAEGKWACCPLPKAVCCPDHEHCCPEGTTCGPDTCLSPQGPVPMLTKMAALVKLPAVVSPPKPNDVPCDDTSACPDDNTCCKTAEGQWACCPLPKAVCCPDHEHCCPEGTTCGPDTCLSPQGPVPMLTKMAALVKLPAVVSPPKPNDVPCDDTSACPDDNTCCKTAEGKWACCPLPKAVCCPDHEHCCPEGTTCGTDTCLSPQGPVPMLTKMAALVKLPAVVSPPKPNDVPCDDTSACPDDHTCCKTAEGGWACCPLPEAVCCDDHIHCCPHGSTCNLPAQTCDSAEGSIPMLSKLPVQGQGSRNMPILPDEFSLTPPTMSQCDHTSSCPHRTTCCFMEKEKTWGCCPFPNALCCKDGEHCCPQGYQCDMDATTCTKGEVTIPWYNKMAAQSTLPSPSQPIAAETCNATSQCSADSSCCQLSDGKMGCCPLTEAVCCADQAHCCPRGYSCNLEADSCQRSVSFQAQMLPLIRVVEQEPEKEEQEPEKKEEPEKQEQEKKEEPEKEEKKPEQEQEKKEEQVPPPSLQLAPEDTAGVICDELTSCQEGETCCRAEEGWGCCPAPNAICCVDKKHCCPAGYTCSTGGVCIQLTRFHKDHWQVFFSKKKRALNY
ncbi:granulin a [Engraulis encrasicolus]|uniref:granulin a n=1 Tax=Engraulis encrasicolus TaxID=184585 RepID=UPI002FD61EF6